MLALSLTGASPAGRLELTVSGLRSEAGNVQVCVTASPAHFPGCENDPTARRLTVRASAAAALRFDGLAAGDYAVAVIHDENGNNRLDSFARIPREGFGFSRNPPIRFGPPSFAAARFTVAGGPVRQLVKMRYLL